MQPRQVVILVIRGEVDYNYAPDEDRRNMHPLPPPPTLYPTCMILLFFIYICFLHVQVM